MARNANRNANLGSDMGAVTAFTYGNDGLPKHANIKTKTIKYITINFFSSKNNNTLATSTFLH